MLTYIFEVGPAVTAEIAKKLSFDNKSRLELVELQLKFSRHKRFHYYEKQFHQQLPLADIEFVMLVIAIMIRKLHYYQVSIYTTFVKERSFHT